MNDSIPVLNKFLNFAMCEVFIYVGFGVLGGFFSLCSWKKRNILFLPVFFTCSLSLMFSINLMKTLTLYNVVLSSKHFLKIYE